MDENRTHGAHSAVDDALPELPMDTLRRQLLASIDHGDHGDHEGGVTALLSVLEKGGWIIPGVPPVTQVLADAKQYADELLLAKLVARFFRVLILGAVVIPETPQAMDWLRDYIDGNHKIHGPLGKPMIWPDRLPMVAQLLREWGFQPTPTQPPYVSPRPGGPLKMAQPAFLDPQAPDPASIPPLPEPRAANMGALLDTFTSGVSCMALDRQTVLRAMSAAFDKGATHFDATPIYPALIQLRDHQQQANNDGSMVTVSRQAIDEVVTHLAGDPAFKDDTELAGKISRLLGPSDDHGHPCLAEDATRSELADTLNEVHERLTGEGVNK